jgi:hypothetical protein
VSRNRRDFDYAIANAFLVGYHEERTEVDPPDSLESEMTQNVIR